VAAVVGGALCSHRTAAVRLAAASMATGIPLTIRASAGGGAAAGGLPGESLNSPAVLLVAVVQSGAVGGAMLAMSRRR
jgi:hypothetical protein